MEIKGAIFDLDGTLLDSMWVWNQVDIDFLGKRGFDVPPDYPKAIAAMGFHETAEYTIKRFDLKEKVKDVIAEWQHRCTTRGFRSNPMCGKCWNG